MIFHSLQYGDGLKAFVINLLVCQMVSLNRVQKLVKSMIGSVLSEASLLKFVLRLHRRLSENRTPTAEIPFWPFFPLIFIKYNPYFPQMTEKNDSKWASLATAPILGQPPSVRVLGVTRHRANP
ncbi:MAG: hypothetical protein DSZ28_06210 [Thiothrix sp.]|nr:MAG: hypothetical protein DSZ28_06210 [Thiothrix sp.]